jgi:hypothetical protein
MRRLAGDRSESQHPREKSFAAEWPLVEKRVLGVSWGVLGVQPVLGVLVPAAGVVDAEPC